MTEKNKYKRTIKLNPKPKIIAKHLLSLRLFILINMKILKKPDNIIFDTENPNFMEFNPVPKSLPIRLNEVSLKSDYDFLSENFFSRENISHPIFSNFGGSYFYCLEV